MAILAIVIMNAYIRIIVLLYLECMPSPLQYCMTGLYHYTAFMYNNLFSFIYASCYCYQIKLLYLYMACSVCIYKKSMIRLSTVVIQLLLAIISDNLSMLISH